MVGDGKCQISVPGKEKIYKDAGNPTAKEHEAFLAAVAKKKGPAILSDYADAMETLRVTLAANKSMASGKPVKL
jgi:predicted dehydrogenase